MEDFMKRTLLVAGFLVLAAGLPLWGYDTSPSTLQVVPEAIWAAATGGGTWVTGIQITNFGPGPEPAYINVYFDTASYHAPISVTLGPIPWRNSVKYANILETLDALDFTSTAYYGQVGALYLYASDAFQVQAQTVNGNYGKTFPGLNVVAGNTLAQDRPMMIQGLVRNATYRTSVGVYNASGFSLTVRFTIINATNGTVGASFERTLYESGFSSFNPFVQAGITTGDYDNCYLYVEVTAGGTGDQAVMLYGSIANNYTNDTYALMAKQYSSGSTAAPAPPVRY
jgi:hypothetical protein